MTTFRTVTSTVFLATLLAACSEAKFTGSNGNRAITEKPPTAAEPKLSCAAAPAVVKTGDAVAVTVTAEGFDGALYQSATSPAGKTDATLVKGASGYTLEGGAADSLKSVEGETKIEIRRAKDQAAADATCSFVATTDGKPPVTPPGTTDTPSTPTGDGGDTSKPCTPTQQSIGAQIAFLIDNSNSNAATDCPSAKKTGTFNGTDLYECGAETNREKALLAAYDLLAKIAADEPGNAKAKSDLAIASFPSQADYINGWEQESKGWIGADANGRANAANSMLFARKPSGLTPYGAAMSASTELFKSAANDGRAKVAVLVTDGEPTDRDPSAVQAQAEALKAAGVKVIVLTYNETHASRAADHTAMMKKIDASQSPGHWYNTAKYASFDAYMQALIGSGSQGGLVQTLATSGKTIEVKDSAALKDAFLSIVKTQAIGCEK